MSDNPTREYERMTAIEIGGVPVEISSAELCWLQYWHGDEPAQREWEVAGRTRTPSLREGDSNVVLVLQDRRLKGRGLVRVSPGPAPIPFRIFGLTELVQVRDEGRRAPGETTG